MAPYTISSVYRKGVTQRLQEGTPGDQFGINVLCKTGVERGDAYVELYVHLHVQTCGGETQQASCS